jgi:hypothetical protein
MCLSKEQRREESRQCRYAGCGMAGDGYAEAASMAGEIACSTAADKGTE